MGLTVVQDGNGGSKLRQTIPRRKATVSADNKSLKRSLAVHFQSYPLALAEKEQLATASAILVTMTPPNQQRLFQSCTGMAKS